MNSPKKIVVSVIIPCYNQAHFIAQSIRSLQEQTLSEWEGIVVDDGSKDQTAEVVRLAAESDPRIKYCYQTNKGLSAARNRGLRVATGDYLLFLDADDLVEYDKLQMSVDLLERRPEIDAIVSEFRYFRDGAKNTLFYDKNGGLSPWAEKVWADPRRFLEKLLIFNFMSVNSVVIRASIARKIGSFNEKLKALEDWEYWLRGACQGVQYEFHEAPCTRSLIRVHGTSMSHDESSMISAEIPMRLGLSAMLPDQASRHVNFTRLIGALRLLGRQPSRAQTILLRIKCMGFCWVARFYMHPALKALKGMFRNQPAHLVS